MVTPECVRNDLRDIRYYYLRKKQLEDAACSLGALPIKRKVEKYNCAIRKAPVKLFDLYACLYVRGQTQEAVSIELGYTPQYVRKLIGELNSYLSKNVNL